MSLPSNQQHLLTNYRLVRLSLLIGLGLVLFLFESLIPRPLPWLKPGFAHIATLIAIYTMDSSAAMVVVITRVLLGSLISGSLFNPAFVLALGGGIMATLIMSLAKRYLSMIFSIFGVSILGAVIHNLSQLFLVEILIVHRIEIFYLTPLMMLSAIFTGFIVALASHLVLIRVSPII